MQPSELTPTQLLGVFADFFESQQIPYHVVGSMASMAYGEPRMTIDIDIVADLDRRHVPAIIAAFPSPDYYVSETAALEAIRRNSQFNAIHIPSGLKVDVFVPLDSTKTATPILRTTCRLSEAWKHRFCRACAEVRCHHAYTRITLGRSFAA